MDYQQKYLKYKEKYLNLKNIYLNLNIEGGSIQLEDGKSIKGTDGKYNKDITIPKNIIANNLYLYNILRSIITAFHYNNLSYEDFKEKNEEIKKEFKKESNKVDQLLDKPGGLDKQKEFNQTPLYKLNDSLEILEEIKKDKQTLSFSKESNSGHINTAIEILDKFKDLLVDIYNNNKNNKNITLDESQKERLMQIENNLNTIDASNSSKNFTFKKILYSIIYFYCK